MWEKLKEIYGDLFLIATAGWLLAHLILIELYEVVEITETNKWILWVEIGWAVAIMILGIERFIKDLK